MLDSFDKIQSFLIRIIKLALTLLCLGVITQLLINDKILGWDPVGNIQDDLTDDAVVSHTVAVIVKAGGCATAQVSHVP